MKKINWRYGIGEVIIVIIGITLAFALNEFNSSRVEKAEFKQYLKNIVMDMNEEIIQLEKNTNTLESNDDKVAEILDYIDFPKQAYGKPLQQLFEIANLVSFQPENISYQTLVNSGDAKLIKDLYIRKHIESHYASHKHILKQYERMETIHKNYLGDFFIKEIDFSEIEKGRATFFKNPLIKNILISLRGSYQLVIKANDELIESNQQTIKLLKDILQE